MRSFARWLWNTPAGNCALPVLIGGILEVASRAILGMSVGTLAETLLYALSR